MAKDDWLESLPGADVMSGFALSVARLALARIAAGDPQPARLAEVALGDMGAQQRAKRGATAMERAQTIVKQFFGDEGIPPGGYDIMGEIARAIEQAERRGQI